MKNNLKLTKEDQETFDELVNICKVHRNSLRTIGEFLHVAETAMWKFANKVSDRKEVLKIEQGNKNIIILRDDEEKDD